MVSRAASSDVTDKGGGLPPTTVGRAFSTPTLITPAVAADRPKRPPSRATSFATPSTPNPFAKRALIGGSAV